MYKYDLPVEYHKVGSDEIREKIIEVDLLDYQNSYQDDVSNMQMSSRSEINKEIRSKKEQFVFECIRKNLSYDQELDSLIDPLVDKIDTYIMENGR